MIRANLFPILLVFALGASACGPQPVPRWAIHVPPPTVTQTAKAADIDATLRGELQHPVFKPGFLSPEQIAAAAVGEVKLGHGFDAAVLLSIASYRYYQQVIHIFDTADRNVPYNVNRAVYKKHVEHEIEVFDEMDFWDELKYLFSRLDYDENLQKKYEEARWRLYGADESERDNLVKELQQSLDEAYIAPPEELAHPAITDAYLQRLVQDSGLEAMKHNAGFFMAMTPLKRFQLAALRHAEMYFMAPVCKRIARRPSVYRDDILRALVSSLPKERSNAVMSLALAPNDSNLALLQSAYAKESDPGAKLSLRYALIRHGDGDAGEIFDALNSCKDEVICRHAIQLIQWLPLEEEVKVNSDTLVQILSDPKAPPFMRMFAAAILGDISQQVILSEGTVNALLAATNDDASGVATQASRAISTMPKLDRAWVYTMLGTAVPRHALYLRLAEMAETADIDVVKSAIPALKSRPLIEQNAVFILLGSIKGEAATKLLVHCFRHFENNRFLLASILVERGDSRYATLLDLAALDTGAVALSLKIGARSPDVDMLARQLLTAGDIGVRLQTLHLVGRHGLDNVVPDVRQLFSYSSSVYYPGDAFVRHTAISLILFREIQRSTKIGRPTSLPGEGVKFRDGS